MDTFTRSQRSEIMRRVRGRDTGPELVVRRLVHGMGYRYRLHRSDLPGKPDLTFPKLRKVIFVHGCFWHGHVCRAGKNVPSSNEAYWLTKLARNKKRDAAARRRLRRLGWKTLVIWECQLRDMAALRERLVKFLGDRGNEG